MSDIRKKPEPLDVRVRRLAGGWMINALGFSMIYPFLSIYLHSQRGFPMDRVGWVFFWMGLARMVGPLLGGALCDRFGSRALIVFAPAAQGLLFLSLSYGVYRNVSLVAVAGLLASVSLTGGFFQVAADTYVAEIVVAPRRAMAYALMSVGLNIGWMIGPAVGAFLARTPFSLLFAITAFLQGGAAVFIAVFCGESVKRAPRTKTDIRFTLDLFRKHSEIARHCLLCFFAFTTASQLVSTMSVYVTEIVDISKNQLGLAYTLNAAFVILFQFPVNRRLTGVRLSTRASLGAALYALGFFLMGRVSGYGHILACLVIIAFGEIALIPAALAIVTRMAPPRAMGRFTGMFGLARGLGHTLGPWMGGTLFARLSDRPVLLWNWLALGGLIAAAGFLCQRLPSEENICHGGH